MLHNFNAGPSVLPRTVFEQASQAILDFNGTGLSILEIGHRTPLFEAALGEARGLLKEHMQLGSEHEVLFLHGGATTQFLQVPMNLLPESGTAAYIDTGVWATKAIQYARQFGNVKVLASSEDKNYTYIPKTYEQDRSAKYLHITTNNTIFGTQWPAQALPYNYGTPLVADMSSDILSRVIDFAKFDLIYAGAQKNIGAAGTTIVAVKKDMLGHTGRKLPGMLDYTKHIEAGSMLNTPPVFAIYVCLLTLRWLKEQGGVAAIEKINDRKAALLYDTLDALPLFKPTVVKEDRSKMNACFVMDDPALEKAFLEECKAQGMVGVKGHRSVGGFRISLYNALPLESVEAVTGLMKDFARRKG